jgi:GAF domain-containing protein
MPTQSGACVPCQTIRQWRAARIELTPHCGICGARLAAPGTREYQLLALARDGRLIAILLRHDAQPRPVPLSSPELTRLAAANLARIARELAHRARQLVPALRFEFETDRAGRPLAS